MREIAKQLGVSAMTVSRALSNSPKVSLDTQKWISREAARMGYRTNPYLRSWMADRKRKTAGPRQVSLALLNYWKPSSLMQSRLHCRQIHDGCLERARELGYQIDSISVGESGLSASRLDKVLQSRGIRGLLIPPLPASHAHLRLDCSQYSAVTMGFTLRFPDLNRVTLNPSAAMQLMIRQLKRARYRRIGMIVSKFAAGRLNNQHVGNFLLYQETIAPEERVPLLWVGRIAEPKEVREWVKKYRPQVIIGENEGSYPLLKNAGFAIPEELALAVFSRYEEACTHLGVNLSGIDLGNRLVGKHAVEMVANQVERLEYGVPSLPMTLMVTPRWHAGATIRQAKRVSS